LNGNYTLAAVPLPELLDFIPSRDEITAIEYRKKYKSPDVIGVNDIRGLGTRFLAASGAGTRPEGVFKCPLTRSAAA
jgi:hypothetical protein